MTTLPTGNESGNVPIGGDESRRDLPIEGARELADLAAAGKVTITVETKASGEMVEADPSRPPSGGGPYCMKCHPEAPDSPCQRAPHAGMDGRHYHPNLGWWGG